MEISREELRKIPYLNVDAIDPRIVNIMPMWDGRRWCHWLPTNSGLFEVHPLDTFQSDYVAKEAAAEGDFVIPFVELMWQRASWPEVTRVISAILSDFQNLGASIDKIDYFYRSRSDIGLAVTNFVSTELEYIFILARSVFDLLQNLVTTIWRGDRLRLYDDAAEAKRKSITLPDSFRKMLYKGRDGGKPTLRSRQEYVDDFAVPIAVADAYIATTAFFDDIRRFRDKIVHGVADAGLLFSTERGFCIHKDFRKSLGLAAPIADAAENNNIVSLMPLIAYAVVGTIDSCSLFATQLSKQIVLPPELAPGYRIFVRGPHNDALWWILGVSKGGSPWLSERQRNPKTGPPTPPSQPSL